MDFTLTRRGQRWTWMAGIVLVLAAPFLLFPGGWRTLALLALPLIFLGNRLATGRFFRRTPYDVAIALLLFMVLVSLYATYDITVSLPKISGVLLGITAMYTLVGFAHTQRRFHWTVLALLAAIAAFTALILLGTRWGGKVPVLKELGARLPLIIQGLPGAEAGFHPNEVGGALTWLIFLPPMIAVGLWSLRHSAYTAIAGLVLWGMTAIMLLALLLTQSRSAWIGTAAGVGVLLFLAGRWSRVLLLLGLIAVVVILVIVGPQQLTHIFDTREDPNLGTVANINLKGRVEIWSRALYGLQDFPFTGMGMGTFRHVVHILYPLFLVSPDQDIGHAHNELLQAGLDLGLPGLIAFMAVQILGITLAYKTFHAAASPLIRWTAAGGLAGLIAHDVYGITDAVALGAKPGLFFWLLLGLIAAGWALASPISNRHSPAPQPEA